MRTARLVVVLALLVVVLHDFTTPPNRDFGVRAAVFAIDQYRAFVGPRIGKFTQCRFTPTCSRYGRAAILKHGLGVGVWKTTVRIAKCGPWTRRGTVDQP